MKTNANLFSSARIFHSVLNRTVLLVSFCVLCGTSLFAQSVTVSGITTPLDANGIYYLNNTIVNGAGQWEHVNGNYSLIYSEADAGGQYWLIADYNDSTIDNSYFQSGASTNATPFNEGNSWTTNNGTGGPPNFAVHNIVVSGVEDIIIRNTKLEVIFERLNGAPNGTYDFKASTNTWEFTNGGVVYSIDRADNNSGGRQWVLITDQTVNGDLLRLFEQNDQNSATALTNVALWLNDNDGITGYPFFASMDGINPDIRIIGNGFLIANEDNTPSLIDDTRFPVTEKEAESSKRTFSIINGAPSTTLTISSISATGSEFNVSPVSNTNVNGGGETTFDVTFTPQGTGPREATITVNTNDPDEPTYTFKVEGKAITQAGVNLIVTDRTPQDQNGTYTYQGILGDFEYWKHEMNDFFIYGFDTLSTVATIPNTHSITWILDNDTVFNYDSDLGVTDVISAAETITTSPVSITSEEYIYYQLLPGIFDFLPATFRWSDGNIPTITSQAECIVVKGNSLCIPNGDTTPQASDGTDLGSDFIETEPKFITKTFTVENLGAEAINLSTSQPVVTLVGSSDFTVENDLPLSISGNGSETFVIRYTIENTDLQTATISIPCSNTSQDVYTFTISGAGIENTFTCETGTTGDWTTANTWDKGEVPNGNSEVIINGFCTVTKTGAEAMSVMINTEGSLTVASEGELTTTQTTTIDSETGNSGSLIIENGGIFNSILIYKQDLTKTPATDDWHLISSPVSNQSIGGFITAVDNNIAQNESIYALPTYNEANDKFENYPVESSTEFMLVGIGYSTLRSTAGKVSFTGTANVGEITQNISGVNCKWNLLGNPYSSAIHAKDNDDSNKNTLLAKNSSVLDPNYGALYLWDPSSGGAYKTISNASITGVSTLNQEYLQACQGFFVKAIDGGGSFTFSPDMQNHQTNTEFKSISMDGHTWSSLSFTASTSGHTSSTYVAFHPNMTRGLDVTYDAGKFKSGTLNLYTKLLEGSDKDFDIQCLPNRDFETYSIPLGLDLAKSTEVTFSLQKDNFSLEQPVYLYDATNESFIDLTKQTYKTMVEPELEERFFIRFQNEVINSNTNFQKEELNVLTFQHTIRILNPQQQKGMCTIYDVTGSVVTQRELSGQTIQDLTLPHFLGVYIVTLNTDVKHISKKCFLTNY